MHKKRAVRLTWIIIAIVMIIGMILFTITPLLSGY